MPHVDANGTRLWYEERGQGEPLLMTNPTGWPGSVWDLEQVGPLSNTFRVITYDPRGVGRSDKPDCEYSTRLFADDALDLLRAIDAWPAHVFGFSLGGRAAQVMAIAEPGALRSLTLAASDASGGRARGGIPFSVAAALVELPYNEEFWLDHLMDDFPFSPRFRAQHPERIFRLAATIAEGQPPKKLYLRHIQARGGHDMTGRLSEISAPTLVMVGGSDLTPRAGSNHVEMARGMAASIPGAELAFIGDAWHLFPWEAPDETNQTLLGFLERHRGRP